MPDIEKHRNLLNAAYLSTAHLLHVLPQMRHGVYRQKNYANQTPLLHKSSFHYVKYLK